MTADEEPIMTTEDAQDVQDSELELVECDDCDTLLSQEEYDDQGGYCPQCQAKYYRTCAGCHGEYHVSDASEEFPAYCDTCGAEHHTEVADELWETQITDLVGSWAGEEYEIPRLRRLLAYAKQLSKGPGVPAQETQIRNELPA